MIRKVVFVDILQRDNMKIAFFTEMGFRGKISRTHPNMRLEFAWMSVLNADHYHLKDTPSEKYDLGLLLTPKNKPEDVDLVHLRKFCKKIGVLQEGPFWLFQDYSLATQVNYYNNLVSADIIFTHNEQDQKYYKGITNHKDVRVIQSIMIEDPIKNIIPHTERTGIMIGGNFVSWYGGFDSFVLAKSVTDEIYSPRMGRAIDGEEQMGIKQLSYLQWDDWITELSKRKIAIHMMRTHAAGTFALNCSYLGIPCIGYNGLDTQRILHPNLSVNDGDLQTARQIINRLWNDQDFYDENRVLTTKLYKENYDETVFKDKIKEIFGMGTQ